MRPIKFRAWNKKYKEMFSWKRLLELNENNTKEGPNKTIHHEHISLFQMILTNNDIGDAYELMQSTGLLDKNGKEIYEGDIIRMSLDGLRTFVCIYEKGGFQFQDLVYSMRSYAGVYITHYIEIIGNVHENPELLNQ